MLAINYFGLSNRHLTKHMILQHFANLCITIFFKIWPYYFLCILHKTCKKSFWSEMGSNYIFSPFRNTCLHRRLISWIGKGTLDSLTYLFSFLVNELAVSAIIFHSPIHNICKPLHLVIFALYITSNYHYGSSHFPCFHWYLKTSQSVDFHEEARTWTVN